MTLEEIKASLNKCLDLRHKRRKTIPYNDLDKCLHVVEKYIQWMEDRP